MDEQFEKTYDCLILDMIRENANINISSAAKELSCAKSFIIARIEYLHRGGYIYMRNGAFYLTERGKEHYIPLEILSDNLQNKETTKFDWLSPYVPDTDIFEK